MPKLFRTTIDSYSAVTDDGAKELYVIEVKTYFIFGIRVGETENVIKVWKEEKEL